MIVGKRAVRRFEGHTGQVTSAAFSPNGFHALSGSADKTLRFWNVRTAKEILRLEGNTETITCVVFSPDGNLAEEGDGLRLVRNAVEFFQ